MRARLNRWDVREQQVFRQFVAAAETVTLDGSGRFLINRKAAEAAGRNNPLYLCFFLFVCAHGLSKFPGQGSNLHHSRDPSGSSDNAGFLAY